MDDGGGLLTANCSAAELGRCSSQMVCPVDVIHSSIRGQLWRVDALLVVQAVLAAVIVGIGAYGQRYRHHPITRFVFLGATTLFLPIISYVASTISAGPDNIIPLGSTYDGPSLSALVATCEASEHSFYLVLWASLVQIVMINTSTVVAVDDREGQCKGPPLELLVQGVWTFYLGVSLLEHGDDWAYIAYIFLPVPYVLLYSKIGIKYYAFEKARRSFALGRNPGLVSVYMQQLQAVAASEDDAAPPPLLIMGEPEEQVERHPQGYAFKDYSETTVNKNTGLVTIDRVWRLDSSMLLPIATPRLKDLCLSFALFKLLRCRFARYKLSNSGSMGTLNFFRSLLVKKVGEHDRVFGVISEELSFVHDYYYSSLPISYSKGFLPVLAIFLSLLTIGYCILLATQVMCAWANVDDNEQLECKIWCVQKYLASKALSIDMGRSYFDVVPLVLVLVLVVSAEVRDMASYICSNWTKVALICRYVNRGSSSTSFCMRKLLRILLRCRCKLMKLWDGKMGQCSVLVPHPKITPKLLVSRLLLVPDHRRKVKVPAAVKTSIIDAVRSQIINNGCLSNGAESLRRSQAGESFLWACCNGKGTSDVILTWHIATYILEVKHPVPDLPRPDDGQGSPPNPSSSDHKIVATHLSKYCAYLMIWCPELLPDNNAWSKGLYESVKKEAERVLAGFARSPRRSTPEDEYDRLVRFLIEGSKHEVLRNGVKLAKQLVETTINGEETAWKLLADFWSEMILFVAPSDNLKGHSEAIARGGELITLLWALLFHAGIASRPGGEEDGGGAV